jgi:polyisoprenyl-phosphate glycosyltransferase
MGAPKYSVVVPIYNEEMLIPDLVKRLREVIGLLDGPAEVVLVDDGSTDGSYPLLVAANRDDHRFKALQLSRNFGHQLAITAGMDAALGQAVIVMDGDLQDPPEVILEMAARWQDGYEVVYAVRERREGETPFKKLSAFLFYWLLRRIAEIDQPAAVGDFRLIDRRALDAFLSMRENNRYIRGMFSWIGFRQASVSYTRAPRQAGQSKYQLRAMLKLAANGIIGFSVAPLRYTLSVGLLMSVASVCYAIVAIALKLAGFRFVSGYASLLVSITFLSGVQLMVMGMVGHYLARVYDETRRRPLYLVRESCGFARRGASRGAKPGRPSARRRSKGYSRPVTKYRHGRRGDRLAAGGAVHGRRAAR